MEVYEEVYAWAIFQANVKLTSDLDRPKVLFWMLTVKFTSLYEEQDIVNS